MIKKSNFVGRHLLLDVQVTTNKGISEVAYVYNLLEDFSKVMDMTLVYPPIVARFPWVANELEKFVNELESEGHTGASVDQMRSLLRQRNTADAGVSGICVWLESHTAIHTWTEERFFSFDAYSCKEFDAQRALDFILPHFDVEAYNGLNILRTMNEPQRIEIIKG